MKRVRSHKIVKCMICGKDMQQEFSPLTMNGTSPGQPYKLHICDSKECWRKAWHQLRTMYGVDEVKE